VVDIGQHVEHLAPVRHYGVWTQTAPELLGYDLEICSQEARWRGQCQELAASRRSPIERMKLAIAVGDVG
jgi:hypothetical protein